MSNQIVITSGAKVRDLNDVIIGTSGVLSSLAFNVANGVPKLDSNAKILVSQLPNSVMEYQGTWNAATNTPTLTNGGAFNQGDVYLCNVAGTTNFGAGPISFIVGDSAIYSGSIWQRSGGATGSVTSVGLSTDGNAITIGNSPITTSGTITANFAGTNLQYVNGAGNLTTFPTLISSIGLSMPSAFSVSNSPLTANGTIAVTGAGYPSQYIRGDGTLADFPTSGGGGSSVSYYLNGGTSQGTIGGITYYEMSKTADTGTGVDFPKSGDGLIVSFLTDAGDPAQLNIPAGNWNYEIYASMSANGGTPQMYAELYKYDGTTFTLIATSSNEILYDGVNLNLYTFAMTVPATTLALTDRLAVKLYATNSGGKTTTVHTQDSHLCQVITTFSTGITALNGLTAQVQYFATGTSGTDFNISSTTATHTFNIPNASATARGLITTGTQTIAGGKTFSGYASFTSTSGTSLQYGAVIQKGFTPLVFGSNITNIYSDVTTNNLVIRDNLSIANLVFNNSTQTYTFPAASGTIALTSDLSDFVTLSTYQTITANKTFSGWIQANTLFLSNSSSISSATGFGTLTYNKSGSVSTLRITNDNNATASLIFDNTTNYNYTFPAATGTVALTSDLGSYVPTTRTISTTAPLQGGGDLSANRTLSITQATTSTNGYLSSTDWNTFNGKQNALTNPVTGTGTTNYLPKFTGTSTIGNSLVYDNGTNVIFGGTSNTSANPTVVMQNKLGTVLSVAGFNWAGTTTDNNSINSLMIIGGYLNTSSQTIATATSASGMQFYNGGFYWYGNSGLTIGGIYTNTQRMFLTVGGNLIVGSGGDAGYKLDVSGTLRATGAGSFSSTLTIGTTAYITNDAYIGDTTSGTGRFIITDSSNQGITLRRTGATGDRFKMFVGNGTTYTQDNCIILGTNTDIDFYTGSSPLKRMNITNGGNVGINTAGTLAAKLHITAASSTSYAPMIALRDPDNPTYGFTFKLDTAVNGDMRIDRVNAGTDAAVMSFQRSTGNVGIGTSSPTSQATGTTTGILDVSASTGGNLVLHRTGSGDTALFSILKGSNGTFIDSTGAASGANNTIYFRANANNGDTTTLNTIASIYTTYAGLTYGTLQVGNTTTSSVVITGSTTANNGSSVTVAGPVGANGVTDAAFFQLRANDSKSWVIQIDGSNQLATFYNNGSTWSKLGYQTTGGTWTNSDERRKTNIEDLEYGLKEVLQLKPKKFHFKHDTEVENIKQKDMGFIAQEVLPIMPLAVDSGYDGEEQYYSMNYANLIPTLVKAMQEQQAMITSLQEQINELKNK